jgi:hypothetical protein
MKKLFFFVLLCFIVNITAKAQYIWLIPKAGFSMSTQNFKNSDTYYDNKSKYISSMLLGAAVEYGFTNQNRLAIQPEIYYLQKGSQQVSTYVFSATEQFKNTYRYSYLELPVLFKYSLGDVDEKRLSFFSGPSFGYLLSGKYKNEYSGSDGNDVREGKIKIGDESSTNGTDIYMNANRLALSWQLGVSGNMKFGFGSLIAELRYGKGLSNFFKKSSNDYTNYGSSPINNFAFTVGYMIPLDSN